MRYRESKPWTDEEREILKEFYPSLGWKEILERLEKKRSWLECMEEAERLGIKRLVKDFEKRSGKKKNRRYGYRGPVEHWTDEERKTLLSVYPAGLKKDILTALKPRTWNAIQKEASRLKIKRVMRDRDDDEY